MKKYSEILEQALLSLDRAGAWELLEENAEDHPAIEVIEQILVPAMERIGEGWEQGRIALSQVYMSGRICEELADRLLPAETAERKKNPRMAICVLEDYHLLGKRIVYAALRAAAYELKDYGRVTADELLSRVREDRIEIILISVLMLPSALQVKKVTEKFREKGMNIRVIVGGAPFLFDRELWKTVGADAMGKNAGDALQLISEMRGNMTGDAS